MPSNQEKIIELENKKILIESKLEQINKDLDPLSLKKDVERDVKKIIDKKIKGLNKKDLKNKDKLFETIKTDYLIEIKKKCLLDAKEEYKELNQQINQKLDLLKKKSQIMKACEY